MPKEWPVPGVTPGEAAARWSQGRSLTASPSQIGAVVVAGANGDWAVPATGAILRAGC
jgi:hypothetical protein